MTADRVAAIVVSHNAPGGLAQRLQSVLAQVDCLYLVDNGSQQPLDPAVARLPRVRVIANDRNVGLAAALNQGLAAAQADGARWTLLLDHDSTPAPDMVIQLLSAWQGWSERERVALVVPAIAYSHRDIACRWVQSAGLPPPCFRFRFARDAFAPEPVDFAIGSGSLLSMQAFSELGGMREDFFIDGVDTEYCLRARAAGWQVLAVPAAQLHHHLGAPDKKRVLGQFDAFPTHHSPARHYYIARNRILTARRYALRFPAWMAFELCSGAKLAAKVVLYERERRRKLWLTLRGTLDGVRGVSGPVG